ncbi:MAG: septal ring lytic transglycosylase RlpA family protein [Chitinophagaceae bacterium]|nr:MAG: septal ring lytic transglycosylase RlpA family protein [Chitinophagaceae bacterium]
MRTQILACLFLCAGLTARGQDDDARKAPAEGTPLVSGLQASSLKPLYGIASYYADKFNGRLTADGSIYNGRKLSAACNRVPLGTWIRVTNLRNHRTVIVRVNDRLHPKNMRVVDMSRVAAEQLGYIGRGLTQVKVEILSVKGG